MAVLIGGMWVVAATRGGVPGEDAGRGADRASVAVRPFTNLSGDPEHQGRVAFEGIAERSTPGG